jgi:protein-tyrosine phosphatase
MSRSKVILPDGSRYECPDWSVVTMRIMVGGLIHNAKEMDAVYDNLITHIMNLQVERDDAPLLEGRPPINYLWLPIYDDHKDWSPEWCKNAFDWALKALAGDPKNKLYIHCAAGISRSVSMVYGILRAFGMDPQMAEYIVMKGRPQGQINYRSSVERALREYHYLV